jgi:hypothetical protein
MDIIPEEYDEEEYYDDELHVEWETRQDIKNFITEKWMDRQSEECRKGFFSVPFVLKIRN